MKTITNKDFALVLRLLEALSVTTIAPRDTKGANQRRQALLLVKKLKRTNPKVAK